MDIPIGRNYVFTLKVLAPDSFLPLDVTGYSGVLNIYRRENDTNIATVPLSPTADAVNGYMTGTVPANATAGIVPTKGGAADDYYVKDEFAGFISITKAGAADVNVTIERVTLMPTGA